MNSLYAITAVGSASACLISCFLAARQLIMRPLPGCGGDSGCSDAMASRWAWIGRIPVAAVAAAVFAAMGLTAWRLGRLPDQQLTLVLIQFILATWVAGAALWFTGIQVLSLRRLCTYCVAIHALGTVAAVAAMASSWGAVMENGVAQSIVGPLGILGAAGFALLQWLITPVTYRVTSSGRPPSNQVGQAGEKPQEVAPPVSPTLPRTRRTTTFLGGRLTIGVDHWPCHGPPTADNVVAFLFDYTCKSCRQMHQLLLDYVASRQDTCVLMLPIPTHPKCNPNIGELHPDNVQSCIFARLALGIWASDPAAFQQWDRWVFSEGRLAPLGLAMEKAQQLGVQDLGLGDNDEKPDEKIAEAIEIQRIAGKPKTPLLLLKSALIEGVATDASHLEKLMATA